MKTSKIGPICGIISLTIIAFVAISFLAFHFAKIDNEILNLIRQWGPGIAAVFGTISAAITYYGWFKIFSQKQKLKAKEEGKSELQSQIEDFLKSIPDMFSSMSSGVVSQVSTVALSASVVVSTTTYTPVGEIVTTTTKNIVKEVRVRASKPLSEPKNNGQLTQPTTPDSIANEPLPTPHSPLPTNQTTHNIYGKVNVTTDVLVGRRGKSWGTVELLQGNVVVATTNTDEDGNYIFMNVPPGEYRTRTTLPDYGRIQSKSVALSNEASTITEISLEVAAVTPKQEREQKLQLEALRTLLGMPPEPKPAPTPAPNVRAPLAAAPKPNPTTQTQGTPRKPLVVTQAPEPLPEPATNHLPLTTNQPPDPKPQTTNHKPQTPKKSTSGLFVGLGSELNNNAKKGTAIGNNLAIGYDINKNFAVGLGAIYSDDMESTKTLESTAKLRYYLPVKGPFLQAEAGGTLDQSDKSNITPIGGMAAGFRVNVDESWFVEPAVRGGYPIVWGTGITVGKKFGN